VARCERAEEIAAQGQVSFASERTKLRHFIMDGLLMLGEWREMGRRLPAWREDARRRGDSFAGGFMWVHSYVPCLAADRPDEAEEFIRQAVEEWIPGGGFGVSYWALYGRCEAALYRGEGRPALDRLRREWSAVKELNGIDFVQFLSVLLVHLRARATLAAASDTPPGGRLFGPRARLLRAAAWDARTMERGRTAWTTPLARLIRAGIANLLGRREESLALLVRAEEEFTAVAMGMYAAAARRRRGQVLGGNEGGALVEAADAWMAGQDVRDPGRVTAMLAPGFPGIR
jgi:hypothetical protein